MGQTSTGEGTKIAQAAKELNVTSVTIRRYISEFNIETTTDENGVKVLPPSAMDELKEIRRLKEDGLTNPKVMETLEESRAAQPKPAKTREKRAVRKVAAEAEAEGEAEAEAEEAPVKERKPARRGKAAAAKAAGEAEEEAEGAEAPEDEEVIDLAVAAGRSKHTLTCQTCGKVFEHMNPRLRDCLDCYRAKRRERRRGGAERHKNVIQHPLAQQAASKATPQPVVAAPVAQPAASRPSTVRNYRKAIEETRQITSSLKRRLERPDLPEGERRWLEQIYAYELILHQGWRHLADYKAGTKEQAKAEKE